MPRGGANAAAPGVRRQGRQQREGGAVATKVCISIEMP